MAKIKEILLDLNPWWKREFKIDFKRREVYEKIKKIMTLPQIIALKGLRRVGKTTIMMKIVEDAIKNSFPPRNILYYSFDEIKDIEIRDLIREYERIMETNFKEGKKLLLLDEIQKLEGWEDRLKGIYDVLKPNTKIIISGSESLFIRRKSRETLAGRIFEFKVEPLSFREFLYFKNFKFEPLPLYERELQNLFDKYILTLGFPELIDIKEKEIIKKYVKESIVEKVVYRDIPNLFKIKDLSALESLLNIFMEEPGQIVEVSELSKELKLSRQTVANYLEYLEQSFFLRKLYNFSKSRRKVERKLKKYYPSIVSIDLLFREDNYSRSRVFEWLVVNQIKAEFFWRDPLKNEVDCILFEKEPIPIEIKFGKIDFKGLITFLRKFKLKKGYVVSYNKEGRERINEKEIEIIPAFKFLISLNKF
jgi:predicted AAA+ superfamily ATPase